MKQGFKRVTVAVAIAGISGLALAALFFSAGGRFNSTKSIPVGLYWTTSGEIEKGAYVVICPPETEVFDEAKARGYLGAGMCPGGYGYMMKRVLAAKGDAVSVATDGVRVNGELLPLSALREIDGSGRPMPRHDLDEYTLDTSDLLLMSDVSDTSFDGRYYGPINRAQVMSVVRPVITW